MLNRANNQQDLYDVERLGKHRKVVQVLRSNAAEDLIRQARNEVSRWAEEDLCGGAYISEWSSLLSDPALAADVLEQDTPRGKILRMRTPFEPLIEQGNF